MMFTKKLVKRILIPNGQATALSRSKISRSGESPISATKVRIESQGLDFIKDLLDLVDLPLVAMHDVESFEKPCFYIRHDVDHSIERALAIASVEKQNGYHSTYFLLPPGSYPGKDGHVNYYGTIDSSGTISHDNTLADNCKKLIDLGHSIGFHSDIVALSLSTGVSPANLIEREVDWFEKQGLTLKGTASHGSPKARELKFNNRELFSGCIRDGWVEGRTVCDNGNEVELHSLKLEDYGFAYEAYSLPRDSRLSDSGGKWGGRIAKQRLPREELLNKFDVDIFRKHIQLATETSGIKAFSIMTHPIYWTPSFK
jgi:hypothetical protein